MKKFGKVILVLSVLGVLLYAGFLIADREILRNELIRFHVVANSDSEEDQKIKLQVRDAVIACLESGMSGLTDTEQAKEYLQEHLHQIENTANQVLREAGSHDTAIVSLALEEFPKRVYDTFTLPSGVYNSLRIEIGEAQGHNWWCVVFPSLCLPATTDGFQDTAAGAGFPEDLTNTLSGEEGYEIRFFFLDLLGQAENFFSPD